MSRPQRSRPDRRKQPTRLWGAFPPAGLRMRARRAEEHRRRYFVDRFSPVMFVLVMALLCLSLVDAVLTLCLLAEGSNEVNPLMDHLLQRGTLNFLLGKYILTAAGLPLLLIYKNHYLFGTRWRVGYVIPLVVVLYLVLIAYQIFLIVGVAG